MSHPSSKRSSSIGYALLDSKSVSSALNELESNHLSSPLDRNLITSLIGVVHDSFNAKPTIAAIKLLSDLCQEADPSLQPFVKETFQFSLGNQWATVRIAAINAIAKFKLTESVQRLHQVLSSDPSWIVRRAALRSLIELVGNLDSRVLTAATDPHWRIRHCLLQSFESQMDSEDSSTFKRRIEELRSKFEDQAKMNVEYQTRFEGIVEFLRFLQLSDEQKLDHATNTKSLKSQSSSEHEPESWCPFWDWDPAVLSRNLDEMGAEEKNSHIELTPRLIAHSDERIQKHAAAALYRVGTTQQLDSAFSIFADPRHPAFVTAAKLFQRLDDDRKSQLSVKEIPSTKLQAMELSNNHPVVQAENLTTEEAEKVLANRNDESWFLIRAALKRLQKPIWDNAPQALTPSSNSKGPTRFRDLTFGSHPAKIPLGKDQIVVSRIGVSGHYGLPPDGFSLAIERGINLLFWEPNYHTLTQFYRSCVASERNQIHLIVGTFEATAKKIEADVDRALRQLGIDQIRFFLLFWVRSWNRMNDDVRRKLDDMVLSGKIGSYGLSTHSRPLAIEAIEANWNPVMVRHSAAHRGAETTVFPVAEKSNTQIITFNNTCYARLLSEKIDPPIRAEDCYRYSLSQSSVTTCLTAPSTIEQLEQNLKAFDDPVLPEKRRQQLLSAGANVYATDSVFNQLIRER